METTQERVWKKLAQRKKQLKKVIKVSEPKKTIQRSMVNLVDQIIDNKKLSSTKKLDMVIKLLNQK